MEIVLRVGLGIVLAGAALAKLRAPRESIAALSSFGFEDGPVRPIAWAALIAVELALAVAVVLGSDAAAYAAAGLMALFAVLTVAALLRGRSGAPCACFGPGSRVSWLAVLRNFALAAGFALIPSVHSISIDTQGWMWIAIGIALAGCAGLAIAALALAREVGMLRLRLGIQGALEIEGEGPEIGSRPEALSERIGRNGADFGLAVFTSEGCAICQTLAPAIDNVAKDPRVAVATFDEVAEAELWRTLEIPGSPFALALDPEGTVLAKGTFNNLAQLESVLATAERRGHPVSA
jgi:methylamine utilization protein MauE